LVAANAVKVALITTAMASASDALLNIFLSPDCCNAIALSYERLPMVFIPGRSGAADCGELGR
jgi:hypothetical protein